MKICTIVGVRNEAHYLPCLIPYLINKDINVGIIDHDGAFHHDADEVFEEIRLGKPLREALEDADQEEYDEFTFVPMPGQSYEGRDHSREMRHGRGCA